jgi:hypothetical protein
VAKLRRVVAA